VSPHSNAFCRQAIRNQYGRTFEGRVCLADFACAQDIEEQYVVIDPDEVLEDTTLQDPSSTEESDEDLEWRHQLDSDKVDVHQFVGEQSVA
jgi:hypothetical protein